MSVASQYDLCLSGDALHHLQQQGADTTYVPLTQVCSRAFLKSSQEAVRPTSSRGWRCCTEEPLRKRVAALCTGWLRASEAPVGRAPVSNT